MIIKKMTISGFRGFLNKTSVEFAVPDKKNEGSGLTVFVGPNNSGKSTVIEAINLLFSNTNIIPKQSRNTSKDCVDIAIEVENGSSRRITSSKNKGAFINKYEGQEIVQNWSTNRDVFILSGKRSFSSTFSGQYPRTREEYKGNVGDDYRREDINGDFGERLLQTANNKKAFNDCLGKVLDPVPDWTIEASDDSGNVYLEFNFNGVKHSSKGSGDGYINIFNIVDALYDSKEENVIFIDEPEISLHPDLQRKLFSLLKEYSKDKQIIISTHSPYFIDWNMIVDRSKLLRFKKTDNDIKIYEMSGDTKKNLRGITKDINNINKTLSLDTNDIFFLNDNIILVEGLEDVVGYNLIFRQYNLKPSASFFGWGMGGADNASKILNVLRDLGYSKVFTVFDNDKKYLVSKNKSKFKNYSFFAIDAEDIRDKDGKKGLLKNLKTGEINEEYSNNIEQLLAEIKDYFSAENITVEKIDDTNLIENGVKREDYLGYIRNKCLNFELAGGSLRLSEKVGKDSILEYIEAGCCLAGSKDYEIKMIFEVTRSLKTNEIVKIKRFIRSNTLPIRKLRKFYLNFRLKYDK